MLKCRTEAPKHKRKYTHSRSRRCDEYPHTGRLYAAVLTAILIISFGGSMLILSGQMTGESARDIPDDALAAGAVLELDEETGSAQIYDPVDKARREDEFRSESEERGCVVVRSDGSYAAKAYDDSSPDGSVGEPTGRKYYDINLTNAQQDVVYKYCDEYDLPPELAFGVISADMLLCRSMEEGGNHTVMSLNADFAGWYEEALGITDPSDFKENIRCGVYMLQEYYHKYSDIKKVAMCYEIGETAAAELWATGVETSEYADIVASRTATLKVRER